MLKKRLYITALLLSYIFQAGCAALILGAGAAGAGVVWYKGRLQETVSSSVPVVYMAAKAGLRDLKIRITEDSYDNLTARIRGVLADGTKVWVDADSTGPSTTKITIRVGVLGDKTFSLRIRDAIKRHL